MNVISSYTFLSTAGDLVVFKTEMYKSIRQAGGDARTAFQQTYKYHAARRHTCTVFFYIRPC